MYVLIRNCAFGWYNQKMYANVTFTKWKTIRKEEK